MVPPTLSPFSIIQHLEKGGVESHHRSRELAMDKNVYLTSSNVCSQFRNIIVPALIMKLFKSFFSI